MATWCFVSEEAGSCCSPAVSTSLVRTLTYSFGSIAFGSLLQAIISVLRYSLEQAKSQGENRGDDACGTICLCILESITKCLEDVLEYFNQWAYVYVGIYGLSYLESGKQVVELFRARGFTTMVTDNLVGYTLGFAAFWVAILTGMAGILLQINVDRNGASQDSSDSYLFGPIAGTTILAFL
jgi:Plasma-membrane choline transporter